MAAPLTFEVTVNSAQVQVQVQSPQVAVAPSAGATMIIAATPGLQGLQGPQGPSGSGVLFTQASAAATWTINHSLGRLPAAVNVVVGGQVVDADVSVSTSQIVVVFASPQSGQVEYI